MHRNICISRTMRKWVCRKDTRINRNLEACKLDRGEFTLYNGGLGKVGTARHRPGCVLCRVYTYNLTLVNIGVSMRYTIEVGGCMQKYRSSVKQSALTTPHQSMQDSPDPSLPSRNHTQTRISSRFVRGNLSRPRFAESVAEILTKCERSGCYPRGTFRDTAESRWPDLNSRNNDSRALPLSFRFPSEVPYAFAVERL